MTSARRLRVFLASPGDVGEERALARQVLAELPYDRFVRWRVVFEVVAWDQPRGAPLMPATKTPQSSIAAGIARPSECDVVVVILWSRMGTPLPQDVRKPDGSRYRSGTEWEYLEARAAADATGKPLVLVYRRTEPPHFEAADPDVAERQAQFAQVQDFFAEFRDADGSLRGGLKAYEDARDFRRIFEEDFRTIAEAEISRLEREVDGRLAPEVPAQLPVPASPTTTPVFVGPTTRGPLRPQLVVGWDDFLQTYGEPLSDDRSFLAYAVRGFFDNGGGRAYVARVVGAGAAAAQVTLRAPSGAFVFIVEACSPGAWGNRLGVRLRAGTRVGIRVTVVQAVDGGGGEHTLEDWDNLSLDGTAPNFALRVLGEGPRRSRWLQVRPGPPAVEPVARGAIAWLVGGTDGAPPTAEDFLGEESVQSAGTGLRATSDIDDVTLVCIPDHVHPCTGPADRQQLVGQAVEWCERLGDRFLLLSTACAGPEPESIRPPCDSPRAALFAPWISVGAFGGGTTWVPPIGHVAGVLARADFEHGIQHEPVNESVRGLARDARGRSLAMDYDAAQRDTLGRLGVNALVVGPRGGEDDAVRLLSALTTSTAEAYPSLAVQRLLAFIVAGVVHGSRWARFEANDDATGQRLVREISAFLETLWSTGALQGRTPQEAFSVTCDASTSTPADRDNGRAIVLLLLALASPTSAVVSLPITLEAGVMPDPAAANG